MSVRVRVVLGVVAVLAGMPAPAAVSWHLYPSSCTGGSAAVEVPCGTYGRFLLQQSQAPPGCTAVASGGETPPVYAPGPLTPIFPLEVYRIEDITHRQRPTSAPRGSFSSTSTGGGGLQAAPLVQTAPAPAPPPELPPIPWEINRWLAVIDFDGAHGQSTTWLAGTVAGAATPTTLVALDPPALDPLGPVGDLHVLAGLCAVAEAVRSSDVPAPVTVNMSFGRPVRKFDPKDAGDCPLPNVACQIAQVVHHLKVAGSTLVAAAGNHGAPLFPGTLDDVISAGMVDVNRLVRGQAAVPAWETPPTAEALIPGNGLCLTDSWAAPAGSSYSSAMLAGWLVRPLDHPDLMAWLGTDDLMPAWNAAKTCWVLANGPKKTSYCNAAITSLFLGLTSPAGGGCWNAGGVSASASTLAQSSPAPELPSLDLWGDPTHPTPESDPCVPCSGKSFAADLTLDLSRSEPLPGGIVLDEVSLRVNGDYFPLSLTAEELDAMKAGALGEIVVPGGTVLIPDQASVSLWYRLRDENTASCAVPEDCYWSSTPLLLGF